MGATLPDAAGVTGTAGVAGVAGVVGVAGVAGVAEAGGAAGGAGAAGITRATETTGVAGATGASGVAGAAEAAETARTTAAAIGAARPSAARAPRLRDPAAPRRLATAVACAVLLWPLLVATEFRPWTLFDARALASTGEFLRSFASPDLRADFLALVARQAWRTVAMATVGTVLALAIAVPATIASTRLLSISALAGRMAAGPFVVRQALRWGLIALRSIPELVWALIFVRVVGLGPTAGVLAIGLTYGGMLGKVYGEILESGESHAARTLLRNGAGRLQALGYGLLPQNAGELVSYTVYRWECAIRSSVVLGFVGAGGLGQELDGSMKMLAGGEVATMLIVFVGLVALADLASGWLRRELG